MAQIGDDVRKFWRGGASDIEWYFDPLDPVGATSPAWYTIKPSGGVAILIENEVGHEGLNGKFDVQYYEQLCDLDFYQVDDATLAQLYTDLDPLLRSIGMPTRFTLLTGQVVQCTMFWRRQFNAENWNNPLHVKLSGKSTSGLSVFG